MFHDPSHTEFRPSFVDRDSPASPPQLSINDHKPSVLNLTQTSLVAYTLQELATAVQSEVKGLLYDYLSHNDTSTSSAVPAVLAITEMLKDKKGSKRPLTQLFHLKTGAEDHIKKLFRDTCPMLDVSSPGAQSDFPNEPPQELYEIQERFDGPSVESGHKLLIPTKPSNILVSYQPTIDFMMSLERKVNHRLADFKMYLDDFLFHVYLPQVQEQVLVYYHANINGIDAFQADRYPDAMYPLIKARSLIDFFLIFTGIEFHVRCFGNEWYLQNDSNHACTCGRIGKVY